MAAPRRAASFAVPLAFLLLLAFVPMARAVAQPNQLNLTFTGSIDGLGPQAYAQSGGTLLFASVLGEPINSSTAVFTESSSASMSGLATGGSATFSLSGVMLNGSSFSIGGPIGIDDAIPAEVFPLGCWNGIMLPLPASCTSQVPAFYIGGGTLNVTVTSSWQVSEEMDLESAFLNPYGGPIVWGSIDPNTGFPDAGSNVLLVFTYEAAAIDWQDVQTGGSINGTLGTAPVSGSFNQTTSAHEDLFAGTETENGTLAWTGMTPSSLDASGAFSGSSTIPTDNEIDCSDMIGIPGTCAETGFSSQGQYTLAPGQSLITGTYNLTWAVPALTFSGPSTATVSQGVSGAGVPEFNGGVLLPAALGLALLLALRRRGPKPASLS
jgi:hypothetical protein